MDYRTYNAIINGIEVHASYTEESVNEIYIPLLRQLTELQKSHDRRILVMLSAPPAAGKSTLLSFLKYLSENTEGVQPVTIIGMDGFHHYQDYLLNHTTVRDGEEIQMVKIKGAPITFDLELLEERIRKVAAGEECGWPEYDRLKHNPQEDAIVVKGPIVLLEGNYLLLDEPGWDKLGSYADYTIKILAEEEFLKERLIARKVASGNSREEAEAFVERSDLYNARTCLKHMKDTDLTIVLQGDGNYRVKDR